MQLVSYENFGGGEVGRLGELKSPDGTFHGKNVMTYGNGLLGPRPGIVEKTPISMPTGKLRFIGNIPVGGAGGIFIIGRNVYHFDLYNPSSAPTIDGTQLADVDGNTKAIPGKNFTAWLYVTVPGDKVYRIDGSSVNGIDGSPGGVAIEIYGERMLIAESQASPRIFYNDPNLGPEFTGWNSDFFDVGDNWQVTAIREQRQGVTIYKGRSIWVMTGVPGVNAVLRPISHNQPPIHPWQEDMGEDDISIFIPVFRSNPESFNGSSVDRVSHLKELVGPLDQSPNPTLPLRRGLTVVEGDLQIASVIAIQNKGDNSAVMLYRHNGVWTAHETDLDLSGMSAKSGAIITMTDGGGDSASAKIYHTRLDYDRPAFASDQFAQPGDASLTPFDAFVEFPRWESQDSKNVRVRSVTVDFQKWNTGADDTNHFECEITSVGVEENDGEHTTNFEWDEVGSESASTPEGTPARRVFRFHDDTKFGGGFQLALRSIRGVAFKKIVVELEVDPSQPRT